MRKVAIIALLAVVLAFAVGWTTYTVKVSSVEINALAVSDLGGAVLPIKVTLLTPGDGRAYVAGVPEAGQGFGPSAQIALYVAARLSGVPYNNYTALLRVLASDAQVGGPSASGYITAAMSLAAKWQIPSGTITTTAGIIFFIVALRQRHGHRELPGSPPQPAKASALRFVVGALLAALLAWLVTRA